MTFIKPSFENYIILQVKSINMIKEKKEAVRNNLFGKENYMWMLGGLTLLTLSFFLIACFKSTQPNLFDPNVLYSDTKKTFAQKQKKKNFIIENFQIMKKTK